MTTTTQETRPKSYTTRLKEHLEENECPQKYLDLISEFAMEESEKGGTEKTSVYELAYSGSFLEICYTLHPKGLAGEHRGKGYVYSSLY